MAISIYDKPVDVQYTNFMPFEAAMMTGASKQKQYDTNAAKEGALYEAINKVNALEPDVQKKNALLTSYEDKINKAVEEAGGDYSKLGSFITQTNKELQRDLTRGQLASIQGNYSSAMKDFEQLDKLYETGKIPEQDYRRSKQLALQKYKAQGGIGDNPSEAGTYQGWTPYKAAFIEKSLAEQADKFITGWKSDKLQAGWVIDKNGMFFNRDSKEVVNPNDVYKEVMTHLQTPENLAYAQQQAELNMLGRAEDSLTKTVMQDSGKVDKNGDPIMEPVEVPATAEEFQQNYMESLFQGPASSAANKAGFVHQTSKSQTNWKAKADYSKKLEELTIPLQFTGSDLNVSDQITDPKLLLANINNLTSSIAEMEEILAGDTSGMTDIEVEKYKATLGFSKLKAASQNDLLNRAYKETGVDRAGVEILRKKEDTIYDKYPNATPEDIKYIQSRAEKKYKTAGRPEKDQGYKALSPSGKNLMRDLKENADLIETTIYEDLGDVEKWLENNKATASVKPELINSGNTTTDKLFNAHYARNPHSFIVTDSSGAPLEEGDYPADLDIGGITKKSIGGQGRYYSASRKVGEGDNASIEAFYIKPVGKNNLDIVYAASIVNGTDASARAVGADILLNHWDNFTSTLRDDPGSKKEIYLGDNYHGTAFLEGDKYVHVAPDGTRRNFETDNKGSAKGKLDAFLKNISLNE